jgi:hypothetical protein
MVICSFLDALGARPIRRRDLLAGNVSIVHPWDGAHALERLRARGHRRPAVTK